MSNAFDEFDSPSAAPVPKKQVALHEAIKYVESRGNPNAVSRAGAVGTMQTMPNTLTNPGFGVTPAKDKSPAELERVGKDYFDALHRHYGDEEKALRAYNWGPGNMDAYLKTGKGTKGQPMPAETQQYVGKVKGAMSEAPAAKTANAFDEFDSSSAPKTVEKPPENSMLGEAKRQLGLTGRYALEGVASLPAALGNAMEWAGVKGAGGNAGTAAADYLGLPKAEREGEKIVSDITQTLVPGAAGFKAATAIPVIANRGALVKSVVGGGGSGAAASTALNQDPTEEALLGALFGPAGLAVGKGANILIKEGQRFAGGAGGRAVEQLRKTFGDRTGQVIADLRNTGAIVPGERPTAGMAAQAYSPELAALEARARSSPAARLFNEADEATNAAREGVLTDITQGGVRPISPTTGREMPSAFEGIRSTVTDPQYAAAMPAVVPLSRSAQNALAGPEIQPIVRNAMDRLDQAGFNARAAGRPVPRRTLPTDPTRMTVQELDMVAKELASANMGDYNVRNARRVVMDLLNSNPQYNAARQNYSLLSAPQNRADVAGELRDRLVAPANSTEQRATVFANALRNAPQTIKRADLSPRFTTMDEVFNARPDQLEGIRNVERSLARQHSAEAMSKSSGIVPKYKSELEVAAEESPNVMARIFTLTKSALKTIGRRTDKQVNDIINRAMADPNAMADLMAQLPPTERNQVMNLLRQHGEKLQYGIGSAVTPGQSQE